MASNVQGRIRVPFSGPINPYSVNSGTIFLMRIGNVASAETSYPFRIINLNQFVWHPATNTLTAEPDELLEQHTKYCVIVTEGIRGTDGNQIRGDDYKTFISNPNAYRFGYAGLSGYRSDLITAIEGSFIEPSRIVSASVFTTMSATAEVEKMRDQIKAGMPAAADFAIGNGGTRAVFPRASVQNITVSRQIGTAPTFKPEQPPVPLLNVVPNAIGTIAFGRYNSPDYTTNPEQYIPSVFTRTGSPAVQRVNTLYFMLVLPAGTKPSGGWPVAFYGHGLGSTRETLMGFASIMASRGIATIAISVYGHGGGPLGTLTVSRTDGSTVTMPVGGRGIDQNGDGAIGISEGVTAYGPRNLIQFRDGARQTVVDMMQLVRVIETNGVDVDAIWSPTSIAIVSIISASPLAECMAPSCWRWIRQFVLACRWWAAALPWKFPVSGCYAASWRRPWRIALRACSMTPMRRLVSMRTSRCAIFPWQRPTRCRVQPTFKTISSAGNGWATRVKPSLTLSTCVLKRWLECRPSR
ncbi:MAG: hypothetical protein HC872_03895 [Gammaproteobacteria bacterium]|nr:hypothetical protein [Gammaproteobacteria bacterium]